MISVVIPTAREREITQTLVNDLRAINHVDLDIVVATSMPYTIDSATMFDDFHAGSLASAALALPYTNPESTHVVYFTDECHPTLDCLVTMAAFVDAHFGPFIAEFFVGDNPCIIGGRLFARWHMTSRRTIKAIGWLDPSFHSYYGDVDFSMRCWDAGGTVEICPDAKITITNRERNQRNVDDHLDADRALFQNRWPAYDHPPSV